MPPLPSFGYIIPMRESELPCQREKEEKRLPIGRGTHYRGRRRAPVMVYSREHNSLAHRSMVGNYCKFIRAARFSTFPLFPLRNSGFPSLALLSDVLHLPSCTRLSPRKKSPRERPHVPLSNSVAHRSENPFSRSWNCDIPRAKRRNYLTL